MAEKYKEQAVIIRQEEISYGIYSMWLKTDRIAALAKPGQFLSVYCHEGFCPALSASAKLTGRTGQSGLCTG